MKFNLQFAEKFHIKGNLSNVANEFNKGVFFEDFDAELFGFGAFGACVFSGDEEVGFFAYAGGGFAAQGANEVLGLLAAPAGEGAGDDHGFAFEGFGASVGGGFGFEGNPCGAEFFNDGPVVVNVQVSVNAFGNSSANFVHGFDFFGGRFAEAINAVEIVGKSTGNGGTNVANA